MTALGFDTLGIDGRPGPATRDALLAWQNTKQVETTGFLGPLQRELIQSEAQQNLAAVDDIHASGNTINSKLNNGNGSTGSAPNSKQKVQEFIIYNRSGREINGLSVKFERTGELALGAQNAIANNSQSSIKFRLTPKNCMVNIQYFYFIGLRPQHKQNSVDMCKSKEFHIPKV